METDIENMETDVKRVVAKVDTIEEEVGATKKILEKTNSRVEKIEEAIQEHAKKSQQMEEEIAKMNAGEATERITRRRKAMGDKHKGQWSSAFIKLNGWVDWDKKMETMMDSANAGKILKKILESLPSHRRAIIDEKTIYSDLSERIHHLKIVIKINTGTEEKDVWPIRNRILDMHRAGQMGWPGKLKVQVEADPRKKPHVTEMRKLLRWLKRMEVHEQIKVE